MRLISLSQKILLPTAASFMAAPAGFTRSLSAAAEPTDAELPIGDLVQSMIQSAPVVLFSKSWCVPSRGVRASNCPHGPVTCTSPTPPVCPVGPHPTFSRRPHPFPVVAHRLCPCFVRVCGCVSAHLAGLQVPVLCARKGERNAQHWPPRARALFSGFVLFWPGFSSPAPRVRLCFWMFACCTDLRWFFFFGVCVCECVPTWTEYGVV